MGQSDDEYVYISDMLQILALKANFVIWVFSFITNCANCINIFNSSVLQ